MKYFFTFIFICLFAPLSAQDIGALQAVIDKNPVFKDAQYSVYAKYIDGHSVIEINPDYRLSPASILKLFITSAALDILGADYQFKTDIYLSGQQKKSKLYGDVYIKGGGDPTLGSARMPNTPNLDELTNSWVSAIKAAGIKTIEGNIYADNSIYGGAAMPSRTSFHNIGNYYAAPTDGLSVRDNSYDIYFEPASAPGQSVKALFLEPHINGLHIISHVKSQSGGGGGNIYVNFVPASNAVQVYGAISLSDKPLEVSAAMPNPALFLADYFKAKLQLQGIKVKGGAKVFKPENYDDKKLLLTHYSPPLGDIVRYTNKKSFNMYADMLLRAISAHTGGDGSAQSGVAKVRDFLTRLNVDPSSYEVYDGSGLARDNILSCRLTVDLLEAVLKQPYKDIFVDSLSIAGDPLDDGNMMQRLQNSAAASNARVKTGSLDRARSHAGYVADKAGRQMAFCIITNNFRDSRKKVNEQHENIITTLAEQK